MSLVRSPAPQASVRATIEESSERVRCIAAPVLAPGGEVIAAIGISGTVGQINDEQMARIGTIVRSAAMKLSGQLGMHGGRVRRSSF